MDVDAYKQVSDFRTLNQVLLHHLELDELAELYQSSGELVEEFNLPSTLRRLEGRYGLPPSANFLELAMHYDRTFISVSRVRSYRYDNRAYKEVLKEACLRGHIRAVAHGLCTYPS